MLDADIQQGSAEWLSARAGSLGASMVADVMARTKSGWGASRANVAAMLVCERLTKLPQEGYVSPAMQWGKDQEPVARVAYEFFRDVDVVQVGLVRHPRIKGTHASPDGLVGDDGLVEIKCPASSTHIETLLGGTVPAKYLCQVQWQMACTGRAWCDFVSFDPRLPPEMRLFVRKVERDHARIAELEDAVAGFLAEVDATVAELTRLYQQKEAA